ncbi:hypothetical protein H6504_05780 [Candidatus Woesearchaeota archaeon]|nr:hypothetical protein [Candidatus Woesearchaeota archaeon]
MLIEVMLGASALGGALYGFLRVRRQRFNRALKRLAHRPDIVYHKGAYSHIEMNYGDDSVRLGVEGSGPAKQVCGTFSIKAYSAYQFGLRARTGSSPSGGFHEVKLGNTQFDERFSIAGIEDGFVKKLFSKDLQQKLLKMQEPFSIEFVTELATGDDHEVHPMTFTLSLDNMSYDTAVHKQMLELLVSFLHRFRSA